MSDTKPCPNQAKMKDLVRRPLPEDQAEKLARHLERCNECATTVENLLRGDTMAEALRQASKSGAVAVPGAGELITRLRGLWQAPEAPTLSGPAAVGQVCNLPGRLQTGPTVPPTHDFLAPPKAPGELGWLGPFRILKELGAGGMGMVFLAEDTKLERQVALKVMRPELAKPEQKQRFLREAKAAAKVQHDHVVTIYQVGEEGNVPFLAMQLLEGESLDDWLKRGQKASPAMICRIGREVAEGLAAAHARGLIHRDIKPGNLWLEKRNEPEALATVATKSVAHASGSSGRLKILDFGLARATSGQEQLTTPGTIVGTPAFAAPEQFRGEAEVRSDIFSLGAVLYRLCTGRNPFQGNDVLSLIASVSLDTPPAIRDINADIPPALADFITRMLAKEAKDRPTSAREVADQLALIERSLQAADERRGLPPPSEKRRTSSPPSGGVKPRRSSSRKRALVIAALAACIALLLGGVVIYVQTAQGTLRIDNLDENTQVRVEQGGNLITLIDGKGDFEVRLRPGDYRLRMGNNPKDGKVFPAEVTIKRGDKVIAVVRPAPPPLPPPPPGLDGSFPPLDPAWVKKVQALPPEEQVKEIAAELKRRNPGFDGKVNRNLYDPEKSIETINGKVETLSFFSDQVTDLSPVRALPALFRLNCFVSPGGKAKLADLSPLRGMLLVSLHINGANVSDPSPLKDVPLTYLSLAGTRVTDLAPLRGTALKWLALQDTATTDLGPLAGLPLDYLNISNCAIGNLTPLRGMPLETLWCDLRPEHDATVLRSIKTLKTINGKPAAEVLASLAKPFPPLNPAWVKKVQALPAEEQVKEVAAELKRRNPGFDGKTRHSVEKGAVASFAISTEALSDLTPLRAFSGLTWLDCNGKLGVTTDSTLSDLTPIQGLPLTRLACGYTRVKDLAPLRGMKLRELWLQRTSVADLSPLAAMPIEYLNLEYTPVADLAPLATTPLRTLIVGNTKVTDLSLLRGLPLRELGYNYNPARDGAILHSIKTLERINGRPAAEVLASLPKAFPPLDPAWVKKVQSLPAEEQVKEVAAELKRRNPGFDGNVDHDDKPGLRHVAFCVDGVTDISPVRALTPLRWVTCKSASGGKDLARFSDLSPLAGMKLSHVSLWHTQVRDLTPLRDMPLLVLSIDGSLVTDLTPLAGHKLTHLYCRSTGVADLGPLKGQPLQILDIQSTPVRDLTPLKDLPLQHLTANEELLLKNLELLKSFKDLNSINGKPAAEVLANLAKPFPPLDPAWVKKVQALPAEEQVKQVAAELKRRNPGFDGKVTPTQSGAAITGLEFSVAAVTDLSPVRVLPQLTRLMCRGDKGALADLSPLRGLKLTYFYCESTRVSDLSALQGLPLDALFCGMTEVTDLTPLRGMPLTHLSIGRGRITDLNQLRGLKLKILLMPGTKVADLTPLIGMPLEILDCTESLVRDLSRMRELPLRGLFCDFSPWRDSDLLRSIKTLKTINGKPAAEFWKLHDQEKFRFDTWVARVGFMKPDEQLKEVAAELKKRNPGFDGKFNPVLVNNGVVEKLGFDASAVTDLSPVRSLSGLKVLICVNGDPAKRFLKNNRPPAKLADLWPLAGMKLVQLEIDDTLVADLSPLAGLPLRHLWCDFQPERDSAILRGIKSLERINGKPTKDVLK